MALFTSNNCKLLYIDTSKNSGEIKLEKFINKQLRKKILNEELVKTGRIVRQCYIRDALKRCEDLKKYVQLNNKVILNTVMLFDVSKLDNNQIEDLWDSYINYLDHQKVETCKEMVMKGKRKGNLCKHRLINGICKQH